MITSHFHLYPQFIYELFHILYIVSLLSRENGNLQLTLLPMCGFIAQLVEHRTGNVEVTGSNPVEAWIFFRLPISNCINWKIHCNDHLSLLSISAVLIWIISYTLHRFSRENGNLQLSLLPMCGFIAQLVEHRTGNVEVTGSNPVEAWIFFRLPISNCINWKIHCNDHFSLLSISAVHIWIISYTLHRFSRENGNLQLTLLPMCGFIAQLVEHRTGNAEVTGSNPVEAWIFFRLPISNCINWKIHCDDHFSLSSISAVHIWIISYTLHSKTIT